MHVETTGRVVLVSAAPVGFSILIDSHDGDTNDPASVPHFVDRTDN